MLVAQQVQVPDADGGDLFLAESAQSEGVGELVEDLDEVLGDQREREGDQRRGHWTPVASSVETSSRPVGIDVYREIRSNRGREN